MRKQFLNSIEENPFDALPKLAFADWLYENNEQDLSIAYRWAAKNSRHPRITPRRKTAIWTRGSRKISIFHFCLPYIIFLSMGLKGNLGGRDLRCKDSEDAFKRLAFSLSVICKLVEF